MIVLIRPQLARVPKVSKQWFQIILSWAVVLTLGIGSLLVLDGDAVYTAFATLAAGSIALVSIEHLISAKAKDTVRQQVYVAAGSFAILSILTLFTLLS
jgi:hypothetical protein